MNIIITLISIIIHGVVGFEARTGYEPGLFGRPVESFFAPYGNYYLNNRGTIKAGISLGDALSVRGAAGVAGSYYPQGQALIYIPGWYDCYEYTDMKSLEFSAGAEVSCALRFRSGKGDLFAGIAGIWGRFNYASLYTYSEDYIHYDYKTVSYSCSGSGIEEYVGLSYPLARLNHFTLNLETILKGGDIILKPYDMPEQYTWKGYYIQPTSNAPLPRWGVSVGLSIAYDSRVMHDSSKLLDARLKPDPKRNTCCCLFSSSSNPSNKGDLFGKVLQGSSALLLGPVAGSTFAFWGVLMSYDNSYGSEVYPLSWGCYLWAPVGSVLGTMLAGRYFNPGGDWKYTVLGAWLGDIANLFLTEGFILATGGSPWRWSPDGSPETAEGPPSGTYEIIAAGSFLPAVGALIGYNLGVKHALESSEDTLGSRPSWTEYALERSRETGLKANAATIGFDIIDLSF